MSATAGIWDGAALRLWEIGATETSPSVQPVADSAQIDRSSLTVIAGLPASSSVSARTLPCKPLPEALSTTAIPSLSQAQPRTVTRGEEVALAGFIAKNPKFDGILCLPSERATLWAHVSAEEIVSMRQFLTGTMVAAVFAEGVSLAETEAFTDALSDTMSRPENAALRLSALTTEAGQGEITHSEAASRATAALIGAELAATRAYWLGQMVAVIGSEALRAPYRVALESQFVPLIETDGDTMSLAGLQLASERLAT
ncbi:2-dehydro-3-deoxygalactonokinase [Celeribacter sp. ULVN23_4]